MAFGPISFSDHVSAFPLMQDLNSSSLVVSYAFKYYKGHNIWYSEHGSRTHTLSVLKTMTKNQETSTSNFESFKSEQLDFNAKIQNDVAHLTDSMEEIKRMLDEGFRRNNRGKEAVDPPSSQQARFSPGNQDFVHPNYTPIANPNFGPVPNTNFSPLRDPDLSQAAINRGLKMDFPRFDGTNPRQWLRKCHRYFLLNPMPENEKVLTASMYLEEKAEYWYMDYIEGKEFMGWNVFAAMILERFIEEEGENLVGDFNKLTQKNRRDEDYGFGGNDGNMGGV